MHLPTTLLYSTSLLLAFTVGAISVTTPKGSIEGTTTGSVGRYTMKYASADRWEDSVLTAAWSEVYVDVIHRLSHGSTFLVHLAFSF